MIVIPAIDLRSGRCVRLRQGDYGQETVFSDDPGAVALRFVEQGATYLHLVDLDGAREGRPVNLTAIREIIAAGVPCELGGGLRQDRDLYAAFDAGIDRAIIGTQALKQPDWFAAAAQRFPGRLVLGLDAKRGQVATEGWFETSEALAVDIAKKFEALPLAGLIYTDISRDGMLSGPNFEALEGIVRATRLPVVASGGVTTLDDVRRLAQLPITGCIVGRALYEGTLELKEAIQLAGRTQGQ
jgi:phosphoribosylformimino-5-aminoimidazole carboxamide ribotide isomerase